MTILSKIAEGSAPKQIQGAAKGRPGAPEGTYCDVGSALEIVGIQRNVTATVILCLDQASSPVPAPNLLPALQPAGLF